MPGRADERRETRPRDQPPVDELRRMPALIVLGRLPTPAVAVDRAGAILFANFAFCSMVGYQPEQLLTMNFEDIFRHPPADGRWVPAFGGQARGLVQLRHSVGHAVWASMSRSAMYRRDDTVALVTFDDRTEELWLGNVDLDHEGGRFISPASRAR